MRVRKKPWAEAEVSENPYIIKDPKSLKGKWREFFGNDNPIFLEIGCGKGRFIDQNAENFPDSNFIGLERQITVIASAARRISSEKKNLALVFSGAEELAELFCPGELSGIYINFCDPWPKKKWEKRRLTHRNFLNVYKDALSESGGIFFKTDNQTLFEFSISEFSNCGFKLKNISLNLHESDFKGNIMTEYEEKFSSKNNPIYRLEAWA